MLAGARRARRKPTADLRDASPADGGPGGGGEDDVFLRLALSSSGLGLETTRVVRAGPVELSELAIRFDGVRFPIDLSGGVRRFRHLRGAVQRARIELPLLDAAAWLTSRVKSAVPDASRVVAASAPHGVTIGVVTAGGALAFDLVLAPTGRSMRVIVESARADGLGGPPHVAAVRAAAAIFSDHAERRASAFIVSDPIRDVARLVLPNAGARVPSTHDLSLEVLASEDPRAGRVAVVAERGAKAASLTVRAVRALETSELLAEADEAAIEGDADRARAAYLRVLEIAPRHEEASMRLAALDLAHGGRAEAALATMVDLRGLVDGGLLGASILEANGEVDAAYAACCTAAAAEPFGWLAARAWTRASRLAPTSDAARAAVDEALTRAPSFEEARWARIDARLGVGDVRGAMGDVEHLEANVTGRAERHAVLQRAADAFFERGELEEAERLFERSLRYEPKSATAVAGLAKTLRDRGRTTRALDLFARASALAKHEPEVAYAIDVELARALATYAQDRPNAIARIASIPQAAAVAPAARVLEASLRAELGDEAGAARALARLRSIAESGTARRGEGRSSLVAALLDAASLDERAGDLRAARRDLELCVALDPSSAAARKRLAQLARDAAVEVRPATRVAVAAPVREPVAQPEPDAPAEAEPELEDPGELEARIETLTAKLRADPSDDAIARALADLLERLGRDMELFALLAARIEERPDDRDLLDRRRRVLARLAQTARAEGRASEAELYESMASSEG